MAVDLEVSERLERLERGVRLWRSLTLCSLVVVIPSLVGAGWYAKTKDEVIRAKGLIIEDSQGRARIVMGAPIPADSGRKRKDDAIGMIVLGPDGNDRVSVGAPTPSPQILGQVSQRTADGAGIQVHDEAGNERGGFSYLSNNSVVLGLDYPTREAVSLFVQNGFAGMLVHGEKMHERAGLLYNNADGMSVLKLNGGTGWDGLFWTVDHSGQPVLKTTKVGEKDQVDLLKKIGF